MLLAVLLCVAPPSSPSVGAWLTDGTYFNATDMLHVFGGIDRGADAGAASVLPLQAPHGGSYSLTETRGLLGSMDLLPTRDGGDVACQGSINTMEVPTTLLTLPQPTLPHPADPVLGFRYSPGSPRHICTIVASWRG